MTLVASKVASSKPARIPLKICILENTELDIHPVGVVAVVVEGNDQRPIQPLMGILAFYHFLPPGPGRTTILCRILADGKIS